VVHVGPQERSRTLGRQHRPGRVPQQLLLLGQREVHQSAPSRTVDADENQPPVPFTQQTCAPGTCRGPHSPRSCRAASTSRNIPRIPGWQCDRPPPSVFVGRAPPTRSLPSATNSPPSPFLQNPSPSSVISS